MSYRFSAKNVQAFLFLLLLEIGIAIFVHDQVIRPFIGDMLVIWLLVFFLCSFFYFDKLKLLFAGVFIFACLIEIGQYFDLLFLLNLQNNALARIIIGVTFDWLDLLAYAIGAGLLMVGDFVFKRMDGSELHD
ncbi:MAG: DUF2809 domain-containing protein [Anaerolineaceae bacterium]|nr:DUF2809 domain-containing protein [Anaerolineaceae bacterium]